MKSVTNKKRQPFTIFFCENCKSVFAVKPKYRKIKKCGVCDKTDNLWLYDEKNHAMKPVTQ